MVRSIAVLLICVATALPSFAQLEWNGTLDLDLSTAGEDSKFITNEIYENAYRPHLAIREMNLYAFAPIEGEFSIEARIQFDTWGSGEVNPPRLTLAAINWQPQWKKYSVSAGRFISPFGLYPRRRLQTETAFISAPLIYGYFINISDKRGYWNEAGDTGFFGEDDVGLTTLFFGGYTTGIEYTWTFAPDKSDARIAVTNGAPASQTNYIRSLSFATIGRLNIYFSEYWKQGISFSWGSFMQRDSTVNAEISGLEQFRQTLFGTDWVINISRLEFSGEWVYGWWKVPTYIESDSTIYFKPSGDPYVYTLGEMAIYVDLKYEPSAFPKGFYAVRLEWLDFREAIDPVDDLAVSWDKDVTRYSLAVGYNPTHKILLKMSFTNQWLRDESPKANDWALRTILSVVF